MTTYNNWTDATINFGLLSTNEMQILFGAFYTGSVTSAVLPNEKPESYSLEASYPNPFNPSTVIRYSLPVNSHVILKVYNLLGQDVGTVTDGEQEAGTHSVTFDGVGLPSGIYFYRMHATSISGQRISYVETKKFVLTR